MRWLALEQLAAADFAAELAVIDGDYELAVLTR
jgi:hypothetical protein